MKIRFFKREEIDKVKWNSCVHYANNGNVFGYMWFLDHVAKDWDALVEGDYESVFPLVYKEGKRGRKELHQPYWMRELGVYSIHVLSQKRLQAFVEAIPEEYHRVRIALNEQNQLPELEGFETGTQPNYQLMLSRPFEEIVDGYDRELMKTLDRGEEIGLFPTNNLKPEAAADFFRKHATKPLKETDYHALLRIMYNVLHRGWGFLSGVQNREAELLAVNFFIISHKRMLSLMPAESPAGQKVGSLAYLTNAIVRTNAERPMVLDFNSEGVDGFPQQFGATSNAFYQLVRKESKRWWQVL
jgi:hypothetical protein